MTVVTVSSTDQALLLILSIFLAMFLLLSIIALIWVLQILAEVKKIIARAEELAQDTQNTVLSFFEKTGPMIAVVKLLSNLTGAVLKDKKRKDKED